jgi:hypothetical protein
MSPGLAGHKRVPWRLRIPEKREYFMDISWDNGIINSS